jgi:hypothetical protein
MWWGASCNIQLIGGMWLIDILDVQRAKEGSKVEEAAAKAARRQEVAAEKSANGKNALKEIVLQVTDRLLCAVYCVHHPHLATHC